ncbi:TPA: DUF5067 domain-containing protein [Enterococcus faecalis]|nr:DUF5067 domain-containing protein [Enterococcus faecalis]
MKKTVIAILLSTLVLGACNSTKENDNKSSTKETSTEAVKKSSESKEEKSSGDFVKSADKAIFDGTTLKGNAYTVKITNHKVIQPGEKGNEHGEKPVIAFWYDTLVSPDYDNSKPIDPSLAWILNFKAIQDNDPNKINELQMSGLPDDQFLDSQTAEIKPGGTVSSAVAYELSDETTPVTLIAKSFNKEFGKTTINLK